MVTLQQQYDDLKPKVLAAMIWLDDPKNKLLVDKWYPHYKQRLDELTRLERMIRNENVRRRV